MPAWKGACLGATCCSRHLPGISWQPPCSGSGRTEAGTGPAVQAGCSAQCPRVDTEPVTGRGEPTAPLFQPALPCSSRTKNMMWYGVLGTKELLQRTYKNLEQRVQLEVRGWEEQGWGGGGGGTVAPQA